MDYIKAFEMVEHEWIYYANSIGKPTGPTKIDENQMKTMLRIISKNYYINNQQIYKNTKGSKAGGPSIHITIQLLCTWSEENLELRK